MHPASPRPISCIVPVYNGERFLGEAIESIRAQTHPVTEILIVDDGSTDGSVALAESMGPPVAVIRQRNQGPSVARNAGITAARGELIAFLDADDLWMPQKMELQARALGQHPCAGFCAGYVQNFWMDEVQDEARAFAGQRFAEAVPGFNFPSVLCRKQVFERVGLLDRSLRKAEDVDWFLRAKDLGVTHVLLDEVLLRRRLHAGNHTRADLSSRDVVVERIKASLDRRRSRGRD